MDTYVKGFNDMKGRPTISGWWTEMDTLRVAAKKLKTGDER